MATGRRGQYTVAGINAFAVKIYRPNYTRQLCIFANILGKYVNLEVQVFCVYIIYITCGLQNNRFFRSGPSEIWIITTRRGWMITKWDNGTPVITNDDKTRYNQLKSTLFHFLTEFKRIEPFWGSWSFRPFCPLATILAVWVSWPQIRGRSLAFYSAPSCLTNNSGVANLIFSILFHFFLKCAEQRS